MLGECRKSCKLANQVRKEQSSSQLPTTVPLLHPVTKLMKAEWKEWIWRRFSQRKMRPRQCIVLPQTLIRMYFDDHCACHFQPGYSAAPNSSRMYLTTGIWSGVSMQTSLMEPWKSAIRKCTHLYKQLALTTNIGLLSFHWPGRLSYAGNGFSACGRRRDRMTGDHLWRRSGLVNESKSGLRNGYGRDFSLHETQLEWINNIRFWKGLLITTVRLKVKQPQMTLFLGQPPSIRRHWNTHSGSGTGHFRRSVRRLLQRLRKCGLLQWT